MAYEQFLGRVPIYEPIRVGGDNGVPITIAEGEVIAAEDRRRLTPEHYFKPQAAMVALFADLPEALRNTEAIAERCQWTLDLERFHFPAIQRVGGDEDVPIPGGQRVGEQVEIGNDAGKGIERFLPHERLRIGKPVDQTGNVIKKEGD